MDFYKFAVYVLMFYALYYLGMIGFDVYMSKKITLAEDAGEDVDISSAMNKYVPKDAQSIVGSKEDMANMEQSQWDNESSDNEPVEVEYSNGFSALELHKIFEEESGQSFFRGILPMSA